MLAFIYVPLLQRELDTFKNTIWNNHRGRKQKKKPNNFPERYGGIPVAEDDLEVAKLSNILNGTDDILELKFYQKSQVITPDVMKVESRKVVNVLLYLKANWPQY